MGRAVALVVPQRGAGQDRVGVFQRERVEVAVVADGAGGTSGGAAAADQVIAAVERAIAEDRPLMRATCWTQVLSELGVALEGRGQTTAVVAATNGHLVVGASVGDSGAWLLSPERAIELTADQLQKPLLGSGLPRPTAWSHSVAPRDALVLATDGVLKYAPAEAMHAIARDVTVTAKDRCVRMVDAARLPTGGLQDDAGLVFFPPLIEGYEARVAATVGEMTRVRSDDNEGALREALDAWVRAFAEFGSDGLEVGRFESLSDERIRIAGHVWEITSQMRVPFQVEFEMSAASIAGYVLRLGEQQFSRTAESPP